ncbi:Tbc1 domain family member 13 protein, partial [Globisporangium splendens]
MELRHKAEEFLPRAPHASSTENNVSTSSERSSNGRIMHKEERRQQLFRMVHHPRHQSTPTTHRDDAPDQGNKTKMASRGQIDLDQLRDLVFQGIDASHEPDCAVDSVMTPMQVPNQQSIRPIVWCILLGVLDADPALWATLISEKGAKYRDWKREFLGCRRQNVVGREKTSEREAVSHAVGTSVTKRDSMQDEDFALLKEIGKIGGIAQQWMLRILFLYAKLHPALGYMQGMNEILAPIVFVYGTDPDASGRGNGSRCVFLVCHDHGVGPTAVREVSLGPSQKRSRHADDAAHVPVATARCASVAAPGLTPNLYSFRWCMTLLAREFEMPTTLRIWDSLLADSKRFSFLHYVSCALIRCERASLLRNGFSQCLQTLQALPDVHDIDSVLLEAERMREKDRQTDQSRLQSATILK